MPLTKVSKAMLDSDGAVTIEQFGGGLDVADNTAALNAANALCEASGARRIVFPFAGEYKFTTKPNPFKAGIRIIGGSARSTRLVRAYSEAGSITLGPSTYPAPFLHWNGDLADPELAKGGGLEDIGVFSGVGTTGGTAVMRSASTLTRRAGYDRFTNVVISGAGEFAWGFIDDGSAVTDVGGAGSRDLKIDGFYVFRCRNEHFRLKNSKHAAIAGLTISDGGLGVTPTIRINGNPGGVAEGQSEDIHLDGMQCYGQLAMSDCQNVHVSGYANSILNAASALNCTFKGMVTQPFTNNSPSMSFYLPDRIVVPSGANVANFVRTS